MADQERTATKLRILVPDGKHVVNRVAGLLNNHDIPVKVRRNSSLHIELPDDPGLSFAFTVQKNHFIPELVAEGRFPLGFTTTDRLEDYRAKASFSDSHLPFSLQELGQFEVFHPRLRVSLLVKDDSGYSAVGDLEYKRVVTSYLGLARQHFDRHKVLVRLDGRGGKEEGLVQDGDADGAVVVVDRGNTMRRFTLRELGDPVMDRGRIKLLLVCNLEALQNNGTQFLLSKLMDKFQGHQGLNGNWSTNLLGLLQPDTISKILQPVVAA